MTLAPPAPAPVAPSLSEPHPRVVLEDVSWGLYERMLKEVGERPIRLTYDDGRLEIMTLSFEHESVKKIIARLLEAYADATRVSIEGGGSTTFKRKKLRIGLEPDECYYVAHAAAVIGKKRLNLAVDPPPDLAIEIDISPPDVARQPIYAALGVPEVWRFDEGGVTPLRRTVAGEYEPVDRSLSFPDLPMDQFNQFVTLGLSAGQSAAVRALLQWVKDRASAVGPAGNP